MLKVKKIKVLMVGPDARGGISTLIKTIIPVLPQQVELLYLPTVRQRAPEAAGKFSLLNLGVAGSQYLRFIIALVRFRPHLVHIHTSQGLGWLKDSFFVLAGKAFRRRVVVHVHAADFDKLYGEHPPLVQAYTRRVMRLADGIIAVSAEWRERLGRIAPIERVFTFRNCVVIDPSQPHAFGRSDNGANALFLGSVGSRKGVFDLLEAMGHLKRLGSSLHLRIAGYEERAGELARARTRLGELALKESCQLVGDVRGETKTRLLDEASLFVLPSYQEGLPMAVLEAMAAGLPVVTTPVGGLPEVIKDGYNGFLVPPGAVTVLAEKLALLAADPDLRETMGRRNLEIAQKELDVKPYVNRLVTLYESLAGLA